VVAVLNSTYSHTLSEFEQHLDDPDGEGQMSFAAARERDERETYPHEAIRQLAELGAHTLQIPAGDGGRQRSLEELVAASYAVGRRDPAVALSSGLQMWSQLIWLAGSVTQRREMRELLEQNAGVCLAASEAMHGADLLSCECRAEWDGERYLLFGEKWPIGCATQCSVALVLARTQPERGPRSLSWFILGPEALAHPACRRLDKVATLGMRASDVSGLAFDGVPLSPEDVVGKAGAGLELSLKLFQLTRPLVASLSLGPGDTALRLATEFVSSRELYGGVAADLPTVRRALVRAWTDFLIAEVVAVTTVRGAHVDPEGLSVGSLIAKIVVPWLVRQSIDEAAQVLGARFFMRDYAHGTFQKMYRDQSVVSIIDGSTEVCLQALATQLPRLLTRRCVFDAERLALQCDVRQPVPELPYERLEIAARGENLLVGALDALVRLRAGDHPARDAARFLSRHVSAETARLAERAESVENYQKWGASRTAEMADIAAAYTRLHALAACVAFSLCNRGAGLVTERPAWLWMVARRLCDSPLEGAPPERTLVEELFGEMRARTERRELLSALHCNGESHDPTSERASSRRPAHVHSRPAGATSHTASGLRAVSHPPRAGHSRRHHRQSAPRFLVG
jgi:alkylation response protein AidB-like acyl-CoA dehydrogenase